MKKLLLFVIACTLGLFTVNAQDNRLESITQTNEGNNITYVYEEGTNKVVEVREGVHNDEGDWQIVTFLTYNANGQLVSTERGTYYDEGGIDKESYYAPAWNTVEYTYTDGKLTSYVEKEFENWTLYQEACDIKTYTVNYEGDNVVEVLTTGQYYGESYDWDANAWVWGWVDYASTKRIYTYEDGKLVKEESFYYDQYVPGFVSNNDPVTYAYNEAGNCVSATKTQYGNETVTSYIYDVTKLATDVYCFAYPHEVKPVNTNIIATATTGEDIATYNYSFATVAKPLAPANLTAEVLSDTEVKLAWNAVEGATSYNVYNGTELVAESSEAAYTVTGLTAETEYTFTVTAVNDGGESDASNAVTATTLKAVEITPEAIAFGEVTVGGEYWSKAGATREVSVATFGKTVTSIVSDNAFFTLPETMNLTAETITFAVGYDANATAGTYESTITITLANDATYTIPVSATAYAPVTPDVFELAQEITFTDGVYTNTPDFATLHDNYLLPNEADTVGATVAPDAVYTFTLEDNQAVEVKVTGKNGKYAVYAEDDFATSLQRTEKILSTTFSYDFNDGDLDDFILENYDGNDYEWELEEDDADGYYLVSYSYLADYEGEEYVTYIESADERIFTKEAYPITEHSVLAMDININGMFGDTVRIEVTKDGETFTQVGVVCDDEFSYSENWLSKKVAIGAKLAEAGLEFGEYQISLYHNSKGNRPFFIDNLSLTERGLVYPAGKYFLVAAAEDAFTVEVKSVDYDGDEYIEPVKPAPAAPVVEATEVGKTSVVLTWAAVETATSYTVYQGEEAIAKALTETTYTVEGLAEDTEYSFTVTATNENGESLPSNVVTVKTEKTVVPVTACPVVYVVEVTETTIVFAWAPVEGAVSYNVYGEGELSGNTTDTIAGFQMLTPGTQYCFTVTALNSAGVESVHSVEVCATTSGEGIEENAAAFNIYPNPVKDQLFIETEANIETVSIYTLTGVMVYNEQCTMNNAQLNVTSLNSGVYFIKVVTNEGETVQRFIKK